MVDTKNTSELQTADLTQQELAEKEDRANKQKSQNDAAMAFAKYYRDKDGSLKAFRLVGEAIANPDTGLFMGSDSDLKILGPGIYERTGGACPVQYGKDGMIRPLADDLNDLARKTVLFGSERLLFNKNFDQPTSAYAARFDQVWGEAINFAVMGRQSQVFPIHYTGQVGYAPLILMLELCKKKGVGTDISDDNIQNFLAKMLAGGPVTATTERGRAKQRAKNIAIAERIIALEKEVNANYTEKLKAVDEQQGYLRSKDQFEKTEKLPVDAAARADAVEKLLKDKDGKVLPVEEKAKVLVEQVENLNERIDAVDKKKTELVTTLQANTEKLDKIMSEDDPSPYKEHIDRIHEVMKGGGPVAVARDGLLSAMEAERTDLVERRDLLSAELSKLPPDVAPPPPAVKGAPPAADGAPPLDASKVDPAVSVPPAEVPALSRVAEMQQKLADSAKKLTPLTDIKASAEALRDKVRGVSETLEAQQANNLRPNI